MFLVKYSRFTRRNNVVENNQIIGYFIHRVEILITYLILIKSCVFLWFLFLFLLSVSFVNRISIPLVAC